MSIIIYDRYLCHTLSKPFQYSPPFANQIIRADRERTLCNADKGAWKTFQD